MREIKFRVLDKETGKVYPPEEIEHLFLRNGEVHIVSLRDIVLLAGEFELMQFTGLTDKNGKEIYEGDIVKKHHKSGCYGRKGGIGVVEWSDAGFHIRLLRGQSEWIFYAPDGINFNWNELEKIGNIYENPELLEG